MLRSKSSRSAFSDFGNKSNESVLSRTLSSRFCGGDNVGKSIDWNAHKSFEKRRSLDRKPSKVSQLTESQIQRAWSMKEHMGQLEEELKWAKDRLFVVEEERKRAVNDMKEAIRIAHKANMKVNDSFPPKNVGELITEFENLKEELARKDEILEALRKEHDHSNQLEVKLGESDALLSRLKEELSKAKESETLVINELSFSKKKIEELHDDLERRKLSEAKMLESLQNQTEQLQQANLEAEKFKLKIDSLNDKIVSLEDSLKQNDRDFGVTYTKKFVPCAPGEMRMYSELDEMESLRNEVRKALQAEAKSKRAMDDLALVLREVATECNDAKEKVRVTESELQHTKAEVEQSINEANAAKAAASIARDENTYLKDSLAEKEEAMHLLALENERLRISETAATENIKDFKRLFTRAARNLKDQFEEKDGRLSGHEEEKKMGKNFRYDIEVFNPSNDSEDSDQTTQLKDSQFDSDASLQSEPCTPKGAAHHRRDSSSIFTDDGETTNSDDLDHLDNSHFDDSDIYLNQRRKKTMFQRVGHLMRTGSFRRK